MAYLIASLTTLRDEFNKLNPNRDKESDGWIGDADHAASDSDHNPDGKGAVHAIDVDETGPWPAGGSMESFVQFMVGECRKSGESGRDRGRLKYIIYERRIWEASNGWAQRSYSGANAHDKHAHFSGEYATEYENDSSPWGLVEKWGDDVTPDELLDYDDVPNLYGDKGSNPNVTVRTALKAGVSADVKLDDVLALLRKIDAKDFTDEQAIIDGVLAGVDVDALAEAIVAKLPPNALTYDGVKQAAKEAVTEVLTHGTAATPPIV